MHRNEIERVFHASRKIPIGTTPRLLFLVTLLVCQPEFTLPLLLLSTLMAQAALWVESDFRRWIKPFAGAIGLSIIFFFAANWAEGGKIQAYGRGLPLAIRFLTGFAWILWFGQTVSWPELKNTLSGFKTSELVLDLLDGAIASGQLLLFQIQRRFDAILIRLGYRTSPFESLGWALAGGVEMAFDQGARLEESRMLRSAPSTVGIPDSQQKRIAQSSAITIRKGEIAYPDKITRICGLNLSVATGEWLSLAGPSGSGKSTLLRALSGLMPLHAERFERLGSAIDANARATDRIDARVGMVFQNPDDQIFGSTVLEDMIWGLAQRKISRDEALRQSRLMLENLGIAHLADRSIQRLSFGEKKRVCFASTLVCEPEILLCDEPTIGLDPGASELLVSWLDTYARERSLTLIWATHDLIHLPSRVERVIALNEGHLACDGDLGDPETIGILQRLKLLPKVTQPIPSEKGVNL